MVLSFESYYYKYIFQEQLDSLENNDHTPRDSVANYIAVDRISELERHLRICQDENAALAKRLEEAEKQSAHQEEIHRAHELSVSDLSAAHDKGRKVIRTLLEKKSRLEEELEVIKQQQRSQSVSY